jgi:hypothetical protein
MEDYIDPDWLDTIEIGFNEVIAKSASKIVAHSEANTQYFGHQWYSDIGGKKAILIKPGEGYEWHFDNLDYAKKKLTTARSKRFWTHIIYLTDGQPLEIGSWAPDGERVEQTDFSAPEPDNILARIYPKPGKSVLFPCFMVHRIQPLVQKNRWALVDFISSPDYSTKTKKHLKIAFNRYFDENTRSKLLSS